MTEETEASSNYVDPMEGVQRWAQIGSGMVVNIIVWNGNTDMTNGGWQPDPGQVMVPLDDGTVPFTGTPTIGLSATESDGSWVFESPAPPVQLPPTPEEILTNNQTRKYMYESSAAQAMTPVMVSLQLGEATDAETTLARAWQQYWRDLQALDLTLANPPWPTPPSTT